MQLTVGVVDEQVDRLLFEFGILLAHFCCVSLTKSVGNRRQKSVRNVDTRTRPHTHTHTVSHTARSLAT